MGVEVPLTEGVATTLAVFGALHNAFLSALPMPVSKASTDPTVNKRRLLEEFADLYGKAIANSQQLHDPNSVKDSLKSFLKHNGASLLAFPKKWTACIKTLRTKKRPVESDKTFVLKVLDSLASLDISDEKGRSKLITILYDLSKDTKYVNFTGLSTRDSLGAIYLDRKEPSSRGMGHHIPYDSTGKKEKFYTTSLDPAKITAILEGAKDLVEKAALSPLNSETATWLDLTELPGGSLVDLEATFTNVEMTDATTLMKIMDGLYNQSGVAQGLVTFLLEDAPKKAEKRASELGDSPPENAENADKLRKYALMLRQLAEEVQAYRTSASSSTPAGSFAAQFPSTRTIKEAGSVIASSRIGGDTGWTKTEVAPYRSGYSSTDQHHAASSGSGGYGAGAGSGTGSGAGAGAANKGGTTGGMLWRVIDMDRVKECTNLASGFIKLLDDTDSKTMERVLKNTKESLTYISGNVAGLVAVNKEDNAMKLDGLRHDQVLVVSAFLRRARAVMTRHRDRHVMFALRANRGALRYMLYWRDDVPSTKQLTHEYFEKLSEASTKGGAQIEAISTSVESLMREGGTYTGLNDTDIERIVEKFEGIREFRQRCKDRIHAVHTWPSTFLDQLLTDTHVHIIYVLKSVRFALAWMAMSIATKAFMSVYASNVYVKNLDPPAPSLFLLMFFGVNVAMNAGLLTVLWAANKVFKSPSNDFPIDSYLLSAWIADLACSEVAMMGISLAFGSIIATKKAFRYRQEGDRGIRALGQMMLYSYAVILVIPFFRVA